MPKFERSYKDGRKAIRASVSKFSKAEAKKRFGRDDKRAQGSALQDAWFEYLRDEVKLDVLRPDRKRATAKDRLEPEEYALRKEKAKVKHAKKKADRLLCSAEKIAARVGRVVPEIQDQRRIQRTLDALIPDEQTTRERE